MPSATSAIVILAGARTPMGRFQGGLSPLTATDLGAAAISGALGRSGMTGSDVDFAYLGNVVGYLKHTWHLWHLVLLPLVHVETEQKNLLVQPIFFQNDPRLVCLSLPLS